MPHRWLGTFREQWDRWDSCLRHVSIVAQMATVGRGVTRTGMVDNGQLAVSLFDLELRRRWLDAKRVVVGGIDNHDGRVCAIPATRCD